ncbi:hypothetical protein HPB49_021780 [Dermacentor silvarum]|uniref:Uncharacterized protein n=1 Tax=Dermacentor silvarum TaxID=543639 RepID=A0ACB8CHJ2_DERSI|nr:hypothetical protein HPB49_021780 [Dermacentor silvarum]
MNFLKKKIKGHKRGGPESDEVEAAIYAKQLAEGQQPPEGAAKEHTGEEWRFFEQLTQRVQDTVQKTQTTLSKIKESSAITELTRPDYYLETAAAPPDPVSPARSWVNFEESEGAEAAGPSEPAKEPVGGSVKDLVSEPSGELISESVGSPPEAQPAADEDQARKLLEEFGFGIEEPPPPPPSNAPHLDLLSGFGVEEPQPSEALHVDVSDPFDTSFVDTLTTSTEPDPFDTSFVDRCVAAKEAPPPPVEADGSEASPEMSNPFLTDVSATTGETLFSTGDTSDVAPDVPNFFSGSRRSSTNPFDNLEEDLAFFQATLVGAEEASAAQSEASNLLQDIAATFPCESEDTVHQPPSSDPFKCSETEQQQQPATNLFAVAFDDTSPEEAGGSPVEPVGSFDPFSDLSRESQEPIPAALASITPQRENVSPFDIGPSDKREPPAAINSKSELFADFATNEVPPTSSECDFFGKDSGATSSVIASDDPFHSGNVASPPAPLSDDPFSSSRVAAPPKTTSNDIFATSSLSGSVATGSDPFHTTDVTATTSVVSDGHDLFDTSDAADPATTVANASFSNDSFGASAMPASDDPFQTSSTAAPATASGNSLFDTNDILAAVGMASDDPFSASNVAAAAPPGADPFDTSNIQLEPAQNAVPFTDTTAFEAFAAKFEQAIEKFEDTTLAPAFEELDQQSLQEDGDDAGFGSMDIFDPFAPKVPPQPKASPKAPVKEVSQDSFDDDDVGPDLSVVIRPKMREVTAPDLASLEPPPKLQPPPKSPVRSRFNPFDRGAAIRDEPVVDEVGPTPALGDAAAMQRESAESPSTPLFDEDTSQPLEEFRPKFEGDGWEMMLRHPNKKKITGNRYWKKVFVRMTEQNILYLHNSREDADPFQEVPLQACYSLSEMGAQQFDAYGKIFTVKLQYVFYKERMGVRPGQIHKVMQGQITSVGQFAKLGLPLEHAPQVSQLLKLGTQSCEDLKSFCQVVEDALFRLQIHRDRALTYKTEEIQVTVQDEFIVEQDKTGHVWKQKARVRVFFLAFVTGMPDIEVGINDLTRQGKEVVGRYDIMPVVTEEWIRLENCEFHSCVLQDEFENNRIIKLHPPDACLFELMRFRIRPPKARELPLQLKVVMRVSPRHVELRADVLVPGYHSRKHGQVPCEDVQIRFPIPECWVYLFRVEKHFDTGPSSAYTTQLFLLRLDLTSFDQIPASFEQYVFVEFTMPATSVSHTTVRSISVSNENPPEKYVRYLSKHEYRVELELQTGEVPPSETEISSLAAVAQQAAPYEPPASATAAAAAAATSDDSD